MEPRQAGLFPTGIPSLDELLGGGVPRRQCLIVTGDPGSGKTVLCSHVAFASAARGVPVVLASVTSEPHDKLLAELQGFSFFRPELLDEQVFLISTYSSLKKGAKEARDLLLQTVRERKAKLLFIDGLRSIRDLWQDEAQLREFLYELGIGLAALDCVGLFTTEYPVERLLSLPEATTVDGVVSLSVNKLGSRRLRRIEVVKLRGRQHMTGEHLLRISAEGVEVIPRLEYQVPSDPTFAPPRERAAFGLPELDGLLRGGVPLQGTTVLSGSMGIGKTLLGMHFAHEGARSGQPSLFVSFVEPPAALVARAERIGLGVTKLVESGALKLLHQPLSEAEGDATVKRIMGDVARFGVKRLVLDGLSELEYSVVDPDRRRGFVAALAVKLRAAGVTSLFTKAVPKIAGPELDFSDTPIAVLAENLILTRFVELRGRVHRILSVLKMRDSEYEADVREFRIENAGIQVLAPIASATGLLTGSARALGTTIGTPEATET